MHDVTRLLLPITFIIALTMAALIWKTWRRGRLTNRRLHDQEQILERLLAVLDEGIALCDEHGAIVIWSQQHEDITGIPRHEARGEFAWDLDAKLMQKSGSQPNPSTHAMLEGWLQTGEVPADRQVVKTVIQRADGNTSILLQRTFTVPTSRGFMIGSIIQDITSAEQTASALKEKELRYRDLFDRIPAGLYRTTPEGQILEANAALVKILGFPDKETLLAANAVSLYDTPESRQAILRQIDLNGAVQLAKVKLRRNDGANIWVEESVQSVKDEQGNPLFYDGVLVDVTGWHHAESNLRKSEARNRALLQALPDLIFIFSEEGIYLDGFANAPDNLLVPKESFIDRSLFDIMPPDVAQRAMALIERVLNTGDMQALEYSLPFHNGTQRHFEARIVPYLDGNVLSIVRDITKRKLAEHAQQDYAIRLATLHEIDHAIIEAQSPESIAQAALGRIRYLVGSEGGYVGLFDGHNHTLTVFAADHSFGSLETMIGARIALGAADMCSPAFQDFTQGVAYHAADGVLDSFVATTLHRIGLVDVQSVVAVPFIVQTDLIGVLMLVSTQHAAFSQDHIDITKEIAGSLAIAIHQAQLHAQAKREAEDKAMLLDEINHRVKNNLAAIIGLLYAEQRRNANRLPAQHPEVDKESRALLETALDRVMKRIQGLSAVHDMLSASAWSPLPLHELVKRIIHMSLRVLPGDKKVSVDNRESEVEVDSRQASSLALILHELVTNTLKYTLEGRDSTHIQTHITTRPTSPDTGHPATTSMITLRYSDDGPGYPRAVLAGQQRDSGLFLIERLVRNNLQGSLELCNDHGAVATLEFPAPE
ncbi:MAG: PAS domain S-box protein [Anaerolineae bacterium]|nr:PAS domain S-box protein [Anaerolineae bacterium]